MNPDTSKTLDDIGTMLNNFSGKVDAAIDRCIQNEQQKTNPEIDRLIAESNLRFAAICNTPPHTTPSKPSNKTRKRSYSDSSLTQSSTQKKCNETVDLLEVFSKNIDLLKTVKSLIPTTATFIKKDILDALKENEQAKKQLMQFNEKFDEILHDPELLACVKATNQMVQESARQEQERILLWEKANEKRETQEKKHKLQRAFTTQQLDIEYKEEKQKELEKEEKTKSQLRFIIGCMFGGIALVIVVPTFWYKFIRAH